MVVRNSMPPSGSDETDFDFKIYKPNIDPRERDPAARFAQDVRTCLDKCSDLAELDECCLDWEADTRVAKVRVRVRASATAVPEHEQITRDSAIKDLCQGMMSVTGGRRASLGVLTDLSIWGIMPISVVFQSYWTAHFFTDMLDKGPDALLSLAQELIVFAVAILTGAYGTFHFMKGLLGHSIDPSFNLQVFLQQAMPYVSMKRNSAPSARRKAPYSAEMLGDASKTFEDTLIIFKRRCDSVLDRLSTIDANTAPALLRDKQWMHDACADLCKMSECAFVLMAKKKDLLGALVAAAKHERDQAAGAAGVSVAVTTVVIDSMTATGTAATTGTAAATGTATAGAATAATGAASAGTAAAGIAMLGPLVLCGIAVAGAFAETCHSLWDKAFMMRLALEWFRLQEGEDPSNLTFTDPRFQAKWEGFIAQYRKHHPNGSGGEEYVHELGIWLKNEVDAMRLTRELLL
ncbi:919373b5-9c61-4d8d-bc31-ce9f71768648 [Thermothielavioides terrestris]|uniref:919373b5-9c61-4d8d-bc31-ce9f71768648 n=1 Tax=Thermothielavioides terrestris TaxID=2587410 RepID=A0A446BFV9_9PEZI|nr:919373b5-9c61-4d8d-bc31-ce9f71768648 [Thermothielavioides terrestris]